MDAAKVQASRTLPPLSIGYLLAAEPGFEPGPTGPKPGVLPLHYSASPLAEGYCNTTPHRGQRRERGQRAKTQFGCLTSWEGEYTIGQARSQGEIPRDFLIRWATSVAVDFIY